MAFEARQVGPHEPHARERREVVRLVRRIQVLFSELKELRRREQQGSEVQTKELELDELRWRLAAVARRSASDELDAAA